jgi:D-alanine-D-alanine ligase
MVKSVAFVYDTQDNYDIKDRIAFSDFCYDNEAEYVKESLSKRGIKVAIIRGFPELYQKIKTNSLNADIIFNKYEGFHSRNREGLVPSFLELLEIPFVGTDAYGLSLSLNKFHVKLIAEYYGVRTPNFVLLERTEDIKTASSLRFPVIIKPNSEGSSMGVKLINSYDELVPEIIDGLASLYGYPVLCEEYIEGNEISVPVIKTGDRSEVLGVVEFRKNNGEKFEIYSTNDKYYEGYQKCIFDCTEETKKQIVNDTLVLYKNLGCRDFGRIDFRIREGVPYFLEINPLPTLCKGGSFELCARHNNLSFSDILIDIIESATSQ